MHEHPPRDRLTTIQKYQYVYNMKDDSKKPVRSPEQMSDHLRVTYVPTYLLAVAAALLLIAFIVWGILGNVSDKAYYSGVVFPVQGTTDITLPNNGIVRCQWTGHQHEDRQ